MVFSLEILTIVISLGFMFRIVTLYWPKGFLVQLFAAVPFLAWMLFVVNVHIVQQWIDLGEVSCLLAGGIILTWAAGEGNTLRRLLFLCRYVRDKRKKSKAVFQQVVQVLLLIMLASGFFIGGMIL